MDATSEVTRETWDATGMEVHCCELQLLGSPDPLTRLVMKADGVTETGLAELLERISALRASWHDGV